VGALLLRVISHLRDEWAEDLTTLAHLKDSDADAAKLIEEKLERARLHREKADADRGTKLKAKHLAAHRAQRRDSAHRKAGLRGAAPIAPRVRRRDDTTSSKATTSARTKKDATNPAYATETSNLAAAEDPEYLSDFDWPSTEEAQEMAKEWLRRAPSSERWTDPDSTPLRRLNCELLERA
jgi:hypothetical protein